MTPDCFLEDFLVIGEWRTEITELNQKPELDPKAIRTEQWVTETDFDFVPECFEDDFYPFGARWREDYVR